MLVDEVEITVKAGKGGDGAVSFLRTSYAPKGGPDGGNGGKGGSVYLQGTEDAGMLAFYRFKKFLEAEDGVSGKRQNLAGRMGRDLVLKVPVGTLVEEVETGFSYEILDKNPRLIAKGGEGGLGNTAFKSATNQTPKFAENGRLGEVKKLRLTLKLIADIGLVGLPNAGKSSLLSVLTNAHPKIGPYPFTTLEPNLGVLDKIILADIPGLITGAGKGKGLGIKFLKHIEKTKLLVHCIDVSIPDLLTAYKTVRREFAIYKKELTEKKEIILLTKSDSLSKKELAEKVKLLARLKKPIFAVSIYDKKSLEHLKKVLRSYV